MAAESVSHRASGQNPWVGGVGDATDPGFNLPWGSVRHQKDGLNGVESRALKRFLNHFRPAFG